MSIRDMMLWHGKEICLLLVAQENCITLLSAWIILDCPALQSLCIKCQVWHLSDKTALSNSHSLFGALFFIYLHTSMSYIIHINVIITLSLTSCSQMSNYILTATTLKQAFPLVWYFYFTSVALKHNNKTFETAKNVLAPEPNMSEHKPFSATKKNTQVICV